MNIPPKCEDLHLKIAELERRESALREELDKVCGDEWRKDKRLIVDLQQRLTVAEQRADKFDELLLIAKPLIPKGKFGSATYQWHLEVSDVLKPAEDGEGSCVKCNGTGEADSGGVYPWGEGINIQCDCTPAEEIHQSGSEFKMRTGKSSRRPYSLKADQIVEVFGGGETQIARADKTDWRRVEIWRIKP